MTTWIASVLLVLGAAFMAVAAIGIVRMPDFYMRLHAASKAATLGVGWILLGVAFVAGSGEVRVRALLGVAFFLVTIPVSAFLLARSSYRSGVPPGPDTSLDELAEASGSSPGSGTRSGEEPA